MLSRVAERIYWMARYLERAENTARIINVNANLLLDLPKKVTLGWAPLIDITGSKKTFYELYEEANEKNVIKFLISDSRYPGSLVNSLAAARENARTIRDIIPRGGWERVNDLYFNTKTNLPQGLSQRNRYNFLRSVIGGTQLITGLLAGTMTHNYGYDFLRMGRNLERSDMTTRIIDVRTANLLPEQSEELPPYETIQWMSVLQSLSAYQGYRQQIQSRVQRSEVLKYLLQDTDFPRAFSHCLGEVQNSLQHLPRHMAPLRNVNQILRFIKNEDLESLSRSAVHRLVDKLQLHLAKLHTSISVTFFSMQVENKVKPKRKKKSVANKKSKPLATKTAKNSAVARA